MSHFVYLRLFHSSCHNRWTYSCFDIYGWGAGGGPDFTLNPSVSSKGLQLCPFVYLGFETLYVCTRSKEENLALGAYEQSLLKCKCKRLQGKVCEWSQLSSFQPQNYHKSCHTQGQTPRPNSKMKTAREFDWRFSDVLMTLNGTWEFLPTVRLILKKKEKKVFFLDLSFVHLPAESEESAEVGIIIMWDKCSFWILHSDMGLIHCRSSKKYLFTFLT